MQLFYTFMWGVISLRPAGEARRWTASLPRGDDHSGSDSIDSSGGTAFYLGHPFSIDTDIDMIVHFF